jgi:hypothetical protein
VPRFLVADPFDSLAVLRELDRPTLVFHGRRDDIIPFAQGERLHPEIAGSTFVPCAAGHNDLPPPDLDYWGEIRRFLVSSALLDPGAPAPNAER